MHIKVLQLLQSLQRIDSTLRDFSYLFFSSLERKTIHRNHDKFLKWLFLIYDMFFSAVLNGNEAFCKIS